VHVNDLHCVVHDLGNFLGCIPERTTAAGNGVPLYAGAVASCVGGVGWVMYVVVPSVTSSKEDRVKLGINDALQR
jgi:hypothetical protein